MLRKFLSSLLLLPLVTFLALAGWTRLSQESIYAKSHTGPEGARASVSGGQVSVLTQHNDAGRSGANLDETVLNTSNVNSGQFGKLFSRSVDGNIYAQPLYVSDLNVPGSGTHNVVFVATEHNSVFAFDADDPNISDPLWRVNLGPSVPSSDISPDYTDLTPEIGITGTPVVDARTGTLYVVAKTSDGAGYHQSLHALDIVTGAEKFGGPAEIMASVQGSGDGSVGGTISFDPLLQLNRPGLLLQSGVVYIAFGSHGDTDPYHGWILAYDAATLQQAAAYNTTPDGGRGSIWQSGQGLVGDESGEIYAVTANGTCDSSEGCGLNLGNSFIKLSGRELKVTDWFTPYNQSYLDQQDLDIGSGGPLLLPGTDLVVACGKDGILRLVNTRGMGSFNPIHNQDVQEFQATAGPLLGSPIYWNSPAGGPTIYLWGGGDVLKAYRLIDGQFQTDPVSQSSVGTPAGISNSAPLSLSANGNEAGSGIIWACCPGYGDANPTTVEGVLRAFDASDVSRELWSSQQNPARDTPGFFAKFCPPTVAGGKVYVASFSGQLNVYGLLPSDCNYSVTVAAEKLVPAGGSDGTIAVKAGSDCEWAAFSNASFITITSGGSGNGDGTVTYSVAANPGPTRTGTITVAGQTLALTQDSGCTYSVNPVQIDLAGGDLTGAVDVSTSDGCPWQASTDVSWITITSGAGAGSGKVAFSVDKIDGKGHRKGNIMVAGQVVKVTQHR